jgi:mono/diheme cytochrome c family protein
MITARLARSARPGGLAGGWVRSRLLPLVLAVVATGVTVTGCRARGEQRAREYMPDMVRGPAYKAFAPNPVMRNGFTLQRPVFGTIARGQRPFHFGPGEAEAIRAGAQLENPLAATPRVLAEGKALYQTTCQICHGETGNGDGPLAGKIPPPPSYRSVRVLSFSAGRMFHVVTMGSGKMPPYASQLSRDDRWKVVTYVKAALQRMDGQFAAQSTDEPRERMK